MSNQVETIAAAPPQRRRRGARLVEWTLIIAICFSIVSLLKLEPLARNSVQNHISEFDLPQTKNQSVGTQHFQSSETLSFNISDNAAPAAAADAPVERVGSKQIEEGGESASTSRNEDICTFCKGGILNEDLMVPGTGGNTCGSIKTISAGHLNESHICEVIQKEEKVCCPDTDESAVGSKEEGSVQVLEELNVNFCGSNKWLGAPDMTCEERAQILVSRYQMSEQNAKSTLVVKESGCQCILKEQNTTTSPTIDLSLAKYWNGYRIADGIKSYRYESSIKDASKVCMRWPGSLLCKYLTRTDQANNITVIVDIINQSKIDTPDAHTTVMHLRLGDGLCGQYNDLSKWCRGAKTGTENPTTRNCWENDKDCFKSRGGYIYAYPREYYEQVATELLKSVSNSTTIVVVADPRHWTRSTDHRNGDYSIDFAYRDNVISFFRSKGFIVQIHQSSGKPDDDFAYMCSARNFVRGGGGLSTLISSVVAAQGGRVFDPRKFSDVTPLPVNKLTNIAK